MPRISVFINTFNEAKRIRACLSSVAWADEIVVVDMHSSDETVSIAKEFTPHVFLTEPCGYCEPARKFAAAKTTGDWILNIDADELVSYRLKEKLCFIATSGQYDAVYVPRKNYFWGEEMQYAGCGPLQDRPLRFYKRQAVEFSDVIHAGIKLAADARVLNLDNSDAHLVHFSYVSPNQFFEKLQRYTLIEAKALYESGKRLTFKEALIDTWNAFFKRYIKKGKGHKQGEWGFMYCVWTAVYRLHIYAHLKLMNTYSTVDYAAAIEEKYQRLSEDTLKEYKDASHARRH